MKKRVSLLLVLAMLLSMLPVAAFAAETTVLLSVTDEAVTTSGYTYEYTAQTAGTLNVTVGTCSPGWRYKIYSPDGSESIYRTKYSAGETCDYTGEAGNWKIVFYAYSSAEADNVAGTVSFTVSFTPNEASEETTEAPKAEYEVSDTALAVGDNTLTLLDTAVTTIYEFEAPETAVYTFTAPEGAILGYWGAGSWFLTDPGSTTNTYEWTCTGVGQSAYIGVSGVEGEFNLNVAKTGDYTVVETPIVVYENKATLETFTLPEGATLGDYVDVYSETAHTAVYSEADGYYHLDSIDGDVLLVDMNYQDIVLSDALKSDRPVMYAYTTDENGDAVKYDIGTAIQEYEAVMDADGYYPLTEDLILFYDTYAVGAGTYTFYVTGEYNEECVWMYCMRTMNLDNVTTEPSEPETEETEPSTEETEPETEATEPVDGEIVLNESVSGTSSTKYVYSYTPATDGTLTVTVGDGSASWDSDVAYFVGLSLTSIASASGTAAGTYTADVTAGTAYRVRVWSAGGTATPVTVVFKAAETTEPDETEPTEPEKNAYEVSTSELAVGSNTVTMLDTAVTTVFKFKPTETGTYTVTAPAGAVAGNWGSNASYLTDPGSTTNSCEWTCTGVGQSVYIGVSGVEGDITVTVEKQEEVTEPSEPKTEETEPSESETTTPSIPDEDVPTDAYYSITVDGSTTYYTSFTAAALNTNLKNITGTGYVKLYQDISLGASISNAMMFESGTVTLDLNGNTISFAYASVGALYVNGGTLIVVDTSAEGDGLVENTNTSGYGIEIWSGTAYLKSGSVYGGSNGVRLYDDDDFFYMEGGDLSGQRYAVNAPAGSNATISGGTLTATLANQYAVFAASTASVSISGGYFNGTVSGSGLTGGISGGYFIKTVSSSYIAEGCEQQDNDDATYIYKVVDPNATVDPEPSEPETEPSEPETEPSEPETEPSEPETEPSEPETEPSEPAEAGTLISVTDEAVTTTGYTYEYTAATAGTLNVTVGTCSPGWRYKIYSPDGSESIYRTKYSAGESCDYEGEAGNWKIVFYAYSSAEADNVAGTVSFTVTFTPSEGSGEVEKAEYEVSDTALTVGDNTLTLLDTAVTTIYVFEPTETGVYTFTAPEGAILGYWGAGSWFLSDPGSTTNTYEWTCTGVGQSAYIGVSGVESEFNLNVAKTGDYTVVETPIVTYENKATLETFTLPEGATLGGYVDVYGDTHTAVLGDDGYYHLDSVDGDILLIDLDYMEIILSDALKSDRPVMYAYMYDEDGNVEYKYDIGAAVQAYEAVMDENGYYPVTEDIILFYQVYAMQAGTFTFHVTGEYNEECVWMYCMRTMTLPAAAVSANGENVAYYESLADAIAACGEGQYVTLMADSNEAVTVNSDLCLDLNGYNLTNMTVSVGYTLSLIDSTTDDYEGAYGTAEVTGSVETYVTANGKTYLVVAEDGKYSAHCYAVKVTYVSLKPGADALGYKAQILGDEKVLSAVTGYGFNMGVAGGASKTYTEDGAPVNGQFTLRLQGIMAVNGGEMEITASAFVIFGDTTETSEQYTTTMKDTILAVNDMELSDEQKAAVYELYAKYSAVMDAWFEGKTNNIATWAPATEEDTSAA